MSAPNLGLATTPERMRATRIDRFGGPDVIEFDRQPVPRPGPAEALLQVAYCGICRHDLLTRQGAFPRSLLPVTLGHQISGRIVELGSTVTSFVVGDRVMTMPLVGCGSCASCDTENDAHCLTDNPKFLGEDYDGGYAEYVVVPERALVAVPADVPLATASILTCTFGTAYHAVVTRGELRPGELVVVTGASGGIGSHVVRLASALGATVVGVVSSAQNAEVALAAGASDVIVDPDRRFAEELRTRHGRRADLVCDVVGAPTLRESLRSVRTGGRVVVVGNVLGTEATIPPAYLILKEISLLGTKSCTRQEMLAVLELVRAGTISASDVDIHPFSEIPALHQQMEREGISGRAVVAIAGAELAGAGF
ncbi:MAG: alcohol dehydrogenase catalytic domain-containing protein [Cryobacterium sp.]|nr:alcohol dehydrogenase catalytic domain-containing protein [Cryobacterium sp.]